MSGGGGGDEYAAVRSTFDAVDWETGRDATATPPPREAVFAACSTTWAELPDPAKSLRASLAEACPRDFAFFVLLAEDIAKKMISVYQTVRRTMEITKILEIA